MKAWRVLIPLAPLLMAGGIACAGEVQTPPDLQMPAHWRACETDAYLADQDMAGVAVRKAPGTAAALITMLPALRMKPAGGGLAHYGAEVAVVGTDGQGWFLIERAEYAPEDDADAPPRKVQTYGATGKVYQGRGWVHGSRLGTSIVATRGLRAGSERTAHIAHPMVQKDSDPEIEARLLDCEGRAVRLRFNDKGQVREGWIRPDSGREKLCSNQRTTCS